MNDRLRCIAAICYMTMADRAGSGPAILMGTVE